MQEIHRTGIQPRRHREGRVCGIDAALAQRAVAMALPLVEAAMRDPCYGDGGFLHVVVMDPDAIPEEFSFDDAILHEHSAGDRATWDADYAEGSWP